MNKAILLLLIAVMPLYSCSQSRETKEITLEDKIGQMLMVGFRGMELEEQNPIVEDITQHNLGSVILFDYDVPRQSPERNIRSAEQVKTLIDQLQSKADTPLLVGIDQEGGKVVRLKTKFGFPQTLSAHYLGQLDDNDSTRYYASKQARLLDSLGFNVNFAPVVDLNTNPENPVIGQLDRSYAADPAIVIRHARIVVQQHLQEGVIPVLKHFPGHGSAWNDSHKGIADVTDTWQPEELKPYKQLIATDSVPAIMTAHVFNAKLDSTYPATLSRPVISGILRDSLEFHGLVFSDDMQMKAIRAQYGLETALEQAINAGVDILVFGNNSVFEPDITQRAISIIKHLVNSGNIPRHRIERSFRRIQSVKSLLPEKQ